MSYLYTYVCHEDERELCGLEMRSLFGVKPQNGYVESDRSIEPDRSPFMKQKIDIQVEGDSLEQIIDWIRMREIAVPSTFKVVCVECGDTAAYDEQRSIERKLGMHIRGKAEMRTPDRVFGIARPGNRWVFGQCYKNEAIWLAHNNKPHQYSTALSTRMARAVANIAVPIPAGVKAIDPCCGIGTVVVEALSMGIDIVGSDLNPLAVRGARANLVHFGLPDVVSIADIRQVTGSYDAVILDMPYNLCSVIEDEERIGLLRSARRLGARAVIITTESIDSLLTEAGLTVTDRCAARKGAFSRQVLVCTGH